MKKQNKLVSIVLSIIFVFMFIFSLAAQNVDKSSQERQKQYLKELKMSLLPDEFRLAKTALPPTPVDAKWSDWQERTGELPPDFENLPSLPFLPNPLIVDEGGKNIPVKTIEDWNKKKEWIKEQAQHWITGTMPPAPDNLKWTLLEEQEIEGLKEQKILLEFGPEHKAKLHITLLYPPGNGPFPVFMCPWKKDRYDWVQAAVRRGYVGVRFTATDPKYGFHDDSEEYEELYWPEYNFSAINRWAWAVSRTIDYLHLLPEINKEQISLIGLSRNGKMSLWAAAYDDRIKAVVPVSAGTGGENPFRYTTDKYNNETVELLTRVRPHWLHPRLRFFTGREHKLPVDTNSLMALIAPRGLMLTSSLTESAGNYFGIEQAYHSAKKTYDFLGASENIAIDLRFGLHAPANRDMERYLDFFDFVFERGNIKSENKLYHNYSFEKWKSLSKENVNPLEFQVNNSNNLLKNKKGKKIIKAKDWKEKRKDIQEKITWMLGEQPPSLGPGIQPDYMGKNVGTPKIDKTIGSQDISFGKLYYPINDDGNPIDKNLPVVVYLHEYSYSTGYAKLEDIIKQFTDNGFAIYTYDQIGFGTRIEESTLFYNRFPKWSKLGRMVADVSWAITELTKVDFLNTNKLLVAGYSLGGTVALYSAAMDDRIDGVISIAGFTPMRTNTAGKTAEGIYGYTHLHGLLPKLGFFVDEENRIPFDFNEILAVIAPKPVFIIAPTWDQYASLEDVKQTINEANSIYKFYKNKSKIDLLTPVDYNRFSPEMQKEVVKWANDFKE